VIGVAASLALGAVFLLAGGSKIASGRAWLTQAADLGAPRPVATALPWWELVVGGVLVAQIARPIAGAAALATLGAFTALLVVRLAQGRRPPCACFGAWSATPIGWRHVVRNAVFAALAVLVIAVG
jgi:hypothetical protein